MSEVKRVPAKEALQRLKDGNTNYKNNLRQNRDLMNEVKETAEGQAPFATVLHCIDSRVSAELIFDQGVGDIFSIRIAGNFLNSDILGSMEFACAVSTTNLIVVMGHTGCGAVKHAINKTDVGNMNALGDLLNKLQPAVTATVEPTDPKRRTMNDPEFVTNVALTNVHQTIANITDLNQTDPNMPKGSVTLKGMLGDQLMIVGAMYDVKNGSVTFYD